MGILEIFGFVSHIFLVLALGFYLITNMQWYSYKIERVILHHKKIIWHIVFFVIPFFAYFLTNEYFWIYFYFAQIPFLLAWNSKVDKKLVFTARVKRFFAILIFATVFQDSLCFLSESCSIYGVFFPLFFSSVASELIERVLMAGFKREAKRKIESLKDLKIIAITASYGKTSIKNYLAQTLSKKYRVYSTPRSVNTLSGIIKDINENLDTTENIYIVEAGARLKGDIKEIVDFLEPEYVIVGSVGEQHIEYFKTLDNIIDTKLEILQSKKLKKAFVHDALKERVLNDKASFYAEPKDIKADLNSLRFTFEDIAYESKILGSFNALNLASVILVAKEFGFEIDEIQRAISNLKPVKHRLLKIESNNKTILDDSFNGNLKGMLEAIKLSKTYSGRRVIITPGIVESDEASNIKLAEAIDEVFDIIIITGALNRDLLSKNIHKTRKLFLQDKSKMQDILKEHTKEQDLILFANDAPSYI